ncbi:ABC transporter permease [bacterium]|nr:ABC transporter permease [bacterium]
MGLQYPLRLFFQLSALLFRIFRIDRREEMLIDLEDRFEMLADKSGTITASLWLAGQIGHILYGHIINTIFWSGVMFKNYLLIAIRNTAKQKLYALITLSGLICGLAIFILMSLLSQEMKHYDQFHEQSHRIYTLVQVIPDGMNGEQHSAMTPGPLALSLPTEIPEIEMAVRYLPAGQTIVQYADKIFYESSIRFVDESFLQMFSFKMTAGDRNLALKTPYSVVISTAMAKKYFGISNPIGKVLTLNNKTNVTITGVLSKIPGNSSLNFNFLVSMKTAESMIPDLDSWTTRNQAAFVMLQEGVSAQQIDAKLANYLEQYIPKSQDAPTRLYLFPLHRFFLDSEHIINCWNNGNISFTVMHVLSFLALLIACINYMNLSTARFIKRANEVGLRKVVGATRRQLILQFLGESMIMALIALPLAVLLFQLIKPVYIQFIDGTFDGSLMKSPIILLKVLITACMTGLISGLYPAIYLSSFTPIKILQGKLVRSRKGGRIRKVLVVIQFFFSILIVVLTLVSFKQLRHNIKVDLGFNRQKILAINLSAESMDKLELLRREISRHSNVASITAASGLPVGWDPQQEIIPEGQGQDQAMKTNLYRVDYGFTEMLEIPLISGEYFSKEHSITNGIIINKTAAEQLGWEEPLGHTLSIEGVPYIIQGICADYHFRNIAFERIMPSIFKLDAEQYNHLLIKYRNEEGKSGLLEHMEKSWNSLMPDLPFESIDLNEFWLDINIRGDKTVQFAGSLGFITILLSCLGLFGLTAYSIERRIKEIGIRKVLGAAESGVVMMLSREFLVLVGIANIIALPIAYILIHRTIHFIFSYPVNMGLGPFILAAAVTLTIAFGTVASLAFKAARMNSSQALRYE